MSDTKQRNVLVVGGSRGIGAAVVRRFAKEGANVTFSYASSQPAARALGDETGAEAIQSDAASRDAVIALVRNIQPLDVLVVNAGAFISGDPLELDADLVDRMIDINVRAPYHASVEAGRRMNAGGRIIIIGSVNGDRMPFAGAAAYALTKSAVQGLVRGLARDFGDKEITVNAVQPGPTDTDMNPADGPNRDYMHSFMAIKRHATADEVAGLVFYLAGPEAGIITGSLHTIDGGFGA